jgi:hypothetical protein
MLGKAKNIEQCFKGAFLFAPQPRTTSLLVLITKKQERTLKTLTCKELGGSCDQRISATTWDEMVKAMTHHVMENHPDVAKQMEKMHNQDPKQWGREMKPKFDAAPES